MANAIYPKFKEAILEAGMVGGTLTGGTPKASLIDVNDYTYAGTTDEFFDDIPSGAVVATVTLGSLAYTLGAFTAADTAFTSVVGDPSEAVVIWTDSGTPSTSRLVAYIDNGGSLTVTPNGNNITLDLASPVFQL